MKLNLFVSTLDLTPNRISWSRRVIERYLAEPGLCVTVLDAGSAPEQLAWFRERGVAVVPQPAEGSLFRRYLLAEALAQSEFFLLSDNDILPKTEGWLSRGLELAREHPQFGHLVYRMEHSDFAHDHQFRNSEIRSVAKGGGLNIIKRDCRTVSFRVPLLFDPNHADDKLYTEAIRRSGYLVGQFEKLYVEHLGRGESTPAH